MPARHVRAVLLAAVMALVAGRDACAGAFAVAPIRVELRAGQTAGELTIHNENAASTLIQVRAVEWSQSASGEDQYADSRDLLVTPPVFTVAANGEQILRVALRRAPDATRELSYRLFIQEVPPAANPELKQLTMALRISLPVFVAPTARAVPDLAWTMQWQSDGRLLVQATNRGGAHLQLTDFDLQRADGTALAAGSHTVRYLLPGTTAHWTLDVPAADRQAAGLRVHGHGEQGEFTAPLTLLQP
jgi:fimbrial chaperone protein